MKKLDGLTYTPTWVSHMGCLSGCTRYLGLPATDSWIYGATGHAFIINISRDSCPSGPTAWKTQPLSRLGRNIGYTPDFEATIQDDTQRPQALEAINNAREAEEHGLESLNAILERLP